MIWQMLNPTVRSQDIKLQKLHTLTIKAMIVLAHLAKDLKVAAESGLDVGVTVFPKMMDCVTLLVTCAREINFQSRDQACSEC